MNGWFLTHIIINFLGKKEHEVGDIVMVKITSAKTWSLDGEEVE